MATKEEQKQQATDAILQAGQAYLQTDEGMKFFQKMLSPAIILSSFGCVRS